MGYKQRPFESRVSVEGISRDVEPPLELHDIDGEDIWHLKQGAIYQLDLEGQGRSFRLCNYKDRAYAVSNGLRGVGQWHYLDPQIPEFRRPLNGHTKTPISLRGCFVKSLRNYGIWSSFWSPASLPGHRLTKLPPTARWPRR